MLYLSEFQFDIYHVKGLQNGIADSLSRRQYSVTETKSDIVIDSHPQIIGVHDSETQDNSINLIQQIPTPESLLSNTSPTCEDCCIVPNEHVSPGAYMPENFYDRVEAFSQDLKQSGSLNGCIINGKEYNIRISNINHTPGGHANKSTNCKTSMSDVTSPADDTFYPPQSIPIATLITGADTICHTNYRCRK